MNHLSLIAAALSVEVIMKRRLAFMLVAGVLLTGHARAADNLCAMRGVRIYLQESPMLSAHKAGTLKSVISRRATSAPSEVELNLITPFTYQGWKKIWGASGTTPLFENSIIDFWHGGGWLGTFEATVRQARAVGIKNVAIIYSPNGDTLPLGNFATNPAYKTFREAALYGGALTVDSPPAYFFKRGKTYQDFTYSEVKWARLKNLRITVIVSPEGDNSVFLGSVKSFVTDLSNHGSLPDEWVVEDYNSSDDNRVGCTVSINTMAYVASWLAHKFPTARVYLGISSQPD